MKNWLLLPLNIVKEGERRHEGVRPQIGTAMSDQSHHHLKTVIMVQVTLVVKKIEGTIPDGNPNLALQHSTCFQIEGILDKCAI